jgi:hypothetical protein
MFLLPFLPLSPTARPGGRACALMGILLTALALSACGGGGGGSSAAPNTTTANNPSGSQGGTTNSGTPAGTTHTGGTGTNTTGPATQTTASPVTTTVPTGTSSVPSTGTGSVPADTIPTTTPTATYNSCADSIEPSNPSNIGREIYQRYILSGNKFGGDITQGITTAISLQGQGTSDFYFIKNAAVLNTTDGLPIPDTQGTEATVGGRAGQSIAYYQIKNNLLGLQKEEQFDSSKPIAKQLYSNLYAPVFFDRLFTLTAGQEMIQTKVFTKQVYQGDAFKASSKANNAVFHQAASDTTYSVSQRVKFLGITSLVGAGGKTYSTCKFEIQNTEPASTEITTEWYLEGRGILVRSITKVGSSAPIATQELETASESGKTFYPRSN